MAENGETTETNVWILVDQRAKAKTFESVADHLADAGIKSEIVTITEVFGTVAKGAIAGGAERLLRGLRVAMKGRNDEDLVGAVRRARPDILAITDARYVRGLSLLESLTGLSMLQVGIFADYDFNSDWTRSGVQAFVVPHESYRGRLTKAGVDEERVVVGGPAIQGGFARDLDRAAERESFGFGDDMVVLVRGNSIESAALDKLVFQSTLTEKQARFIFHHDGDAATASALRKSADQYGLKALMFGNVGDLERYVLAADVVIAGPDDPYVPEIVALDRPLLFVGDEAAAAHQVDFLVDQGAATHIADLLKFGPEFDRFVTEDSLNAASEAAAQISGTTGSKDVADAIALAFEKRDEWQTIATPPPSEEAPDDSDSAPNNAFEVIGSGGSSSSSGGEDSDRDDDQDFSGISRAEAKEQLAGLIMMERDVERRLDELERNQERWRNRLDLAREWNEDDLASEAEAILRGYLSESDDVARELDGIRRQKDKLKSAARGEVQEEEAPDTERMSEIENRFRKMEIDSDLKGLKDRIRKELGE